MQDILVIDNVTKQYAAKTAARGVSFRVPAGTIFGLLGPNGAGKTTLIRMITRITMPDSGRILFDGEVLTERHQERMGYLPEERGLYRKMKVEEQILYLLELKGMKRQDAQTATDYWLERFELASWAGAKVGDLSKGMQQKVQFIVTIANRPKLIILDEPFSGLDPLNTQLIEEVITELKNEGTTIVFSTHRMEQVEELCSRIVLINDGEAVLDGEVAELRRRGRKNIFTIEAVSTITDFTLPQGWEIILQEPLKLRFSTPDGITAREVLNAITPQLEIIKFEQYLPGLREIFIEEVSKRKPTNAVPAVIPA